MTFKYLNWYDFTTYPFTFFINAMIRNDHIYQRNTDTGDRNCQRKG